VQFFLALNTVVEEHDVFHILTGAA
jgi:hypothetical protein